MAPTSLLQQSLVNTVPHTIMVHWYLLWSLRELISRTYKSGLTFLPHIIDVWHVPSVYVACEGLSDLVHGQNKPTATTIGEYSVIIPSWYTDTYSGQGANSSFRPKSCLTFWPHIIDVLRVLSVYVGFQGLSDLGHGHNQPTATIIGEYSASYHHGTLILTLVRARIHPSDQNLA